MSVWQIILTAGFILAVTVGRADWRLACIMAVNFAVTYAAPDRIGIVGAIDLATAAGLLLFGPRGQVIAMLYIIAAAINATGAILGWPTVATYAILDPIGWVMLVVLGNGDSGIRRVRNALGRSGRRGDVPAYLAGKRGHPGVSVALVSGTDKGLT